jgi:hypothetical protein
MAEHVQIGHSGSRVVRWGSVVLFLAAAAVTFAVAWPVIHSKLPGASPLPLRSAPPVLHLTPLQAKVAATGSVAGGHFLTVHGDTLWLVRWSGRRPAELASYSAHALKPAGHPIGIGHMSAASTGLATGSGGVYLRTAMGLYRVNGQALVHVGRAAVPRPLLLSLFGAAGFDRAWTTDGRRLSGQNPGDLTPRTVAIPRPVGAAASSFIAAGAQPVVFDNKFWLSQAIGTGTHRTAQVQPLGEAGHLGGRPIGLGRGKAGLELVAAHRLWVVVRRSPRDVLDQVDPATGRVIGSVVLPRHFDPVTGFATGRALWLASSGSVVRMSLTHPASS